jgi:hypothetical protein
LGTSVVVLSGRSLFAEGVAARLRQHADRIDLVVVETDQKDVLGKIVAVAPETVILDATDAEAARLCSLTRLFGALPAVRVVRLDPERDQIQLVTSEERVASDVTDLIDVIQPPEGGADVR